LVLIIKNCKKLVKELGRYIIKGEIMNGLYEPEKEKQRVQEIREMKRAVRLEKAKARKEKREKYKKMYKEELAKERAKLQAQKEKDIEVYKTKSALDRAQRKARSRVKPFTPRRGLKIPSKRLSTEQKRKLKKAGIDTGKTIVSLGQKGLNILDAMYGGGKGGLKVTKRRSGKRKTTPTKRKTSRKTPKRKGKTYYCYKCKARHSYTSKIGRKHRR
jgi:hypothetical protein